VDQVSAFEVDPLPTDREFDFRRERSAAALSDPSCNGEQDGTD
jgi:hypothetical protein